MLTCVGGMFRAHIVQAAEEQIVGRWVGTDGVFAEYDVFNDRAYRKASASPGPGSIDEGEEKAGDDKRERRRAVMSKVPSLAEVTTFYRDVFRKSQMEVSARAEARTCEAAFLLSSMLSMQSM